jgi:hypothetical protein
MQIKLAPCKKCGATCCEIMSTEYGEYFYVTCISCLVRGDCCESEMNYCEESAVASWNAGEQY